MMNNVTPSYLFDIDIFQNDIKHIKRILGDMPLTYSMKANPVLVNYVPDDISHIEVCSPGEFEICKKLKIPGERIVYSGVLKRENDILTALEYGVDIITAESVKQFEYIKKYSREKGYKTKVILRLTSGNQFGISRKELISLIKENASLEYLDILGLHYYSGTQKKRDDQIKKDLDTLNDLYIYLKYEEGYVCKLVEYGPGMAVDYFEQDIYSRLYERLNSLANLIKDYDVAEVIGLEFGRALAASCGKYRTKVCDIKENSDINFVITDGGTHQLRYYGQNMAMQIPPMNIDGVNNTGTEKYSICGGLCTVADVMVRTCELPTLEEGDVITFGWCGAYSSTEGSSLFLSRELPAIYIKYKGNIEIIREIIQTCGINVTQ